MKKKISRLLLFVILLNLLWTESGFAIDYFKDQKDISPWAVEHILDGVDNGFISGYKDGSFKPKKEINRAEFTKLMVEMLGLKKFAAYEDFLDVKKTDWFYDVVGLASSHGIVKGSKGRFEPRDTITREEMAVIVDRALDLKEGKPTSLKDRKDISTWAVESVDRVIGEGLVIGSNGNFNPKGKVTREMASTVIMRSFKYKEDKDGDKPVGPVDNKLVAERIDRGISYIKKEVKNPMVSSIAGEWSLIALNRSNRKLDKEFNRSYMDNLLRTLKEKDGQLHPTRYTEYSRVILGLNSMGENPEAIGGYNLVDKILDLDRVKKQGINGPIFSLIALNSMESNYDYEKEVMVDFILERELDSGGWALSQEAISGDIDVTAMVLQALAPLREDPKVSKALDRGVVFLSRKQDKDGGYVSWGKKNSENVSQVIIALTSLGIDPHQDSRFIKEGNSLLDFLLAYQNPNGGFKHEINGRSNLMASEQGLLALIAYERMIEGESSLYDMSLKDNR